MKELFEAERLLDELAELITERTHDGNEFEMRFRLRWFAQEMALVSKEIEEILGDDRLAGPVAAVRDGSLPR